MQLRMFAPVALLVLAVTQAFAQTPITFEVATVKPSAPLDMMKLAADVKAGNMPKIGARVDSSRAEYNYVALKDLIALAYGVKARQVEGPDWMADQRFDIAAKFPAGATKDDVPAMLRELLAERFKMTAHKVTKDNAILALVVGKNGIKVKETTETAQAIDPTVPLKPGETRLASGENEVRMTTDLATGRVSMNMGKKGTMTYSMDQATMTMHLQANMLTMGDFAELLTQFTAASGGAPIVDMTGLKGNYPIALDISMSDLLKMARSVLPSMPPEVDQRLAEISQAQGGSDPGTGSANNAVQALGLKLEPRKVPAEYVVVDKVEKTPVEN